MKNGYFYLFAVNVFIFNKCDAAKKSYFPEIYIVNGTAEIELSYYKDIQVCLNVGYISQMHFPYFEYNFDFFAEKFIKSHHIIKIGLKFSMGSDFWIWNKRMQNIEIDINYLYKLFDYRSSGVEYTSKNINISILLWSDVFGFGIDFTYLNYDSFYIGFKFGIRKTFLYGNFSVCSSINKRFIKFNNIKNENNTISANDKIFIKEITNDYDPMNILSIFNLDKITTSLKGNAETIINSMPYYYLIDDLTIKFVKKNAASSFINDPVLDKLYTIIDSLYNYIQITNIQNIDPNCFEKQLNELLINEKNKIRDNEFFCNKFRFCKIDDSKITMFNEQLNESIRIKEDLISSFNNNKSILTEELETLKNNRLDYINDSFNVNLEVAIKKISNDINSLFIKDLIKCYLEDDLIDDFFINDISQNNEFIQILNNAKCEKDIIEKKIKYIEVINYYVNSKYINDPENEFKKELNKLIKNLNDNKNEIEEKNTEIKELKKIYNENINKINKECKEIFYKKRKYELIKKYNDEIICYFTSKGTEKSQAEKDRIEKENQENIKKGNNKGFFGKLFSRNVKTAKQAESKNSVNENKKHDWILDIDKQKKVIKCILKMYDLDENDEKTKFVLNDLSEYLNIETLLENHKNKKQEEKKTDIIYRITNKIKECLKL